jgi:hypothetical protein
MTIKDVQSLKILGIGRQQYQKFGCTLFNLGGGGCVQNNRKIVQEGRQVPAMLLSTVLSCHTVASQRLPLA